MPNNIGNTSVQVFNCHWEEVILHMKGHKQCFDREVSHPAFLQMFQYWLLKNNFIPGFSLLLFQCYFFMETLSLFFFFCSCQMCYESENLAPTCWAPLLSIHSVFWQDIHDKDIFLPRVFFFPNCLFIQLSIKYASAYCLLSMAKFMHEIPLQIIFSPFTLTQFYLNQILSSHKATSVFLTWLWSPVSAHCSLT